jgi:pimeloyl-ACP methyl ester carboxylesterase
MLRPSNNDTSWGISMRALLYGLLGCLLFSPVVAQDVWDQVEHRYADSNGVKIHYAVLGEGPLVVMIHGFPDFWYTWRHQMRALADHKYRVAAVDLRGYDLSDQPKGVESYAMPLLVGDIAAVVKAEKQTQAIIVGHDWGGAVAWNVAMTRPEITRLLIICNLPHPAGIEYAFNFQKPDAHKALTAERLAGWVRDPAAKPRYIEAFNKSDFESMLNYYKANYPKPDAAPPAADVQFPKVKVPVLMFHGLDDQALLPGALNGTWQWVEKDLTIVTIPGSGHFVQQDAAETVSDTMVDWLERRRRQP